MKSLARASPAKQWKNDQTSIRSSSDRARSPQNRRGNSKTTLSIPTSQATCPTTISTHGSPPPRTQQTQEFHRELPSTVLDSLNFRMAVLGSQSEGDTQPISQGVIEEYNRRSKLQDAAKQHVGSCEGTGETRESTERSYHPGQTGHVDLIGAFEQPNSVVLDESSEGDSEDFDPLSQAEVRAELYPESKRFQPPRTPATTGRKRDRSGEFKNGENSTPRMPLNPFAGQMHGFDSIMDASQAFKATQAVSSPIGHVTNSDGLSQRPSPDMYNFQRPATADPPSSPSKMAALSVVRATTEPRTKYISMQESQAERDRLAKRKSASSEKSASESSDDFGSDDSQLRRRRYQKEIALKAKRQLDGVTAPTRPGSSGRKRKNQQVYGKGISKFRSGNQPSKAVIISDDLPGEGNVTEDETEQEDERIDSEAEEIDELADENKENIDVPRTGSKNDWATQILASQPTPSRQRQQGYVDASCTEQVEGCSVAARSDDSKGEDSKRFTETQTSAVTDSQSSRSCKELRQVSKPLYHSSCSPPEPRDSINKAQLDHIVDLPISVPRSSPALARNSMATLASNQLSKSGPDRDSLSANSHSARGVLPLEVMAQPTTGSSHSTTSSTNESSNRKLLDKQVAVSTFQSKVSTIPQQVEQGKEASLELRSSPLSKIPTITPPSVEQVSRAKDIGAQSGLPANFTTAQPSQSLTRINFNPSSYSVVPEVSTGSTPFETARTAIDSKSNDQNLQHSEPDISSPSLPLRSLAQIAADPSPLDMIGEVDMDINLLTNEDIEFQAVISGSSPVGPRRRRRCGNSIQSTKPAGSAQKISSQISSNLDVKENPHQDTRIVDALPYENFAPDKQMDKISKVVIIPNPSTHEATNEAPKKKQTSGGRLQIPQPLDAPASKNPVIEKEANGTSRDSGKKSYSSMVKPAPALRESGSEQGTNHRFVAPDRVFAHFNGNFPAFYPATCLGVIGRDQSRYRVRFDDGTEDDIGGFGIKRLELRVGDSIKFDMGGSRTKTYVVQRLNGQRKAPKLALTDVYGYESVVVSAKQRQSVTSSTIEGHEFSVAIKDIYLTQTMWTHFKDRPYVPALSAPSTAQTPSEQPLTTSTPSSHRGSLTKNLEVSIPQFPKTIMSSKLSLFENMVFVITNIENKDDRKCSTRQIIDNGGRILGDGFDEIFDIPNLDLAPPASQGPKKIPASKFGLTREAQSLGFTCLIADKHCRTAKFVQALALGIPCLATRWIQDCVAKEQIVPWEAYLLASGESSFLGGAIRSRVLPPYPPDEVTLPRIVENRPKLLDGKSILLIMSKKEEDKMKVYPFYTHALGARKVSRASSSEAAVEAIARAHADGDPWDLVYSHDKEKQVDKVLFGDGSCGKKRKREKGSDLDLDGKGKKTRVVGNEFIVQSLILGRLADLE